MLRQVDALVLVSPPVSTHSLLLTPVTRWQGAGSGGEASELTGLWQIGLQGQTQVSGEQRIPSELHLIIH